jgi:hypothetical protein
MSFDALLITKLEQADAAYMSSEWAQACDLLLQIFRTEPTWAALHSVPLMLAHCWVELAPADTLDQLPLSRGLPCHAGRETQLVQKLRFRAIALARAGDYRRGSILLRVLADYDPTIAEVIRTAITSPAPASAPAPRRQPDFYHADPTLAANAVAAVKQRFSGTRVMVVYRRLFAGNPNRAYDPVDVLVRSAMRFGMTVHLVDAYHLPPGVALPDFASWLQQEILSFKPHVIIYDDLFESGLSAAADFMSEQIGTVLQSAREILGVRVVKSLLDAWMARENGADRDPLVPALMGLTDPMKGIGVCVDLVQHMHPALQAAQSPEERAHSFCYLLPFELPRPTVPHGTMPRACFVGSISWFNIARLVWWIEAGARGIPFDFHESDHTAAVLRSDQDYANLFHQYQVAVNFTRRSNGTRILTARTIEILQCEGVLVEEDCDNTAYFLAAGSHYAPFDTIDELQGLIDDLLRSEARRRSLSREGHQWVQEYFSGDRFWAGLLARLFD